MKIQDYLPYYIGAQMTRKGFSGKLIAVNYDGSFRVTCSDWWEDAIGDDHYKLILRPLDSMTKEEFEEFKAITDTDFSKMVVIESASDGECFTRLAHQLKSSAYLLYKHFDLFNLIPSGLALDATKLTTTVK